MRPAGFVDTSRRSGAPSLYVLLGKARCRSHVPASVWKRVFWDAPASAAVPDLPGHVRIYAAPAATSWWRVKASREEYARGTFTRPPTGHARRLAGGGLPARHPRRHSGRNDLSHWHHSAYGGKRANGIGRLQTCMTPAQVPTGLMSVCTTPMRIRTGIMPVRTTPVRIGMDLTSTDATLLQTGMGRLQACFTPGSTAMGFMQATVRAAGWTSQSSDRPLDNFVSSYHTRRGGMQIPTASCLTWMGRGSPIDC